MNFNKRISDLMNETLLEGTAEYNDVLDAVEKLKAKVGDFAHVYPMDRGSHVHASFKAEVDRMTSRVNDWINQQTAFVLHQQDQKAKADAAIQPAA